MADGLLGTTNPMDPNTGSADQTLLAVLKQIGDLQRQPLVPDNPLAQIGSAFAGFAAGTQGRPNPVLEGYRQDREAQIRNLLSTAQIAGTIDSMQHRRVTEELARRREDRTAQREADRLDLDKKKLAHSIGQDQVKMGKELGSADMIKAGLGRYRDAGVPMTDDQIEALSSSTAAFEQYQKTAKTSAAYYAAGLRPPPGFENPAIEGVLAKTTDPQKRALLLQHYDLDEMKIKGAVLDHQIKEFDVREVQLRKLQEQRPLTLDEQAEFQAIVGSKNKSDVREIASGMREADRQAGKPAQPFYVYLTAAFDAKREPRDIEILRDALIRQNPGMTKDQATLAATAQQAEARVPLLLQQRQAQMQFQRLDSVLDEVETYSNRLKVRGVFGRIAGMPKRELEKFLQTDQDIVNLSRATGKVAVIAKSMGDVGNIAEKEQERAIALLPGINDVDATREAKIRDLRALSKKNREAALEIFTNPYSPTAKIGMRERRDPANPGGLADDPLVRR